VKGPRINLKDKFLLGITVLLVLAGAFWLGSENFVQRVFLVSDLGIPVEVSIDGKVTKLSPGGQAELSLLRGVHEVRAMANGKVIDEGPIDVLSTDGVVAYNLLGASPLYNDPVHYGTGSANTEGFEFYGGQRLVTAQRADFVFTTPPQSISVEQSSSASHVRWHFDRAKGGWQSTLGILEERGSLDRALGVSLKVAEKDPTASEAIIMAAAMLERVRGVDPALAYLEKFLEGRPDAFEVHRTYLHYLRRADRFEQARTYYREFRRTHEGTLPLVLLARAEPLETALLLYREVQGREPNNKLARRGLARLYLDLGRYPESAELFAQVAADDPDYKYYADDHVRSLIRQGRRPEALEVAKKAVEKAPTEWRLAVLHAHLAAAAPASGSLATTYIDRFAQSRQDPGLGVWMRSLVGIPVDEGLVNKEQLQGEASVLAARVQLAAAQDLVLAWGLCSKATPATLERVLSPIALLLGTEFLRAGDAATADRLLSRLPDLPLPTSAFTAYVMDGVEHPELWRLDDDARAALDFVRARKLEADGGSGEALYASALRREDWPGIVTRARATWPAPRPGKALVTLVRRPR
jgi:tetratricopeptide (TPR) repeat protein